MLHCIARIFEPLLRILWPVPEPHRSPDACRVAAPVTPPPAPRWPPEPVLRGEDSPLVRPYLIAHEQREEARRQRARRRALWLAVHSVDIGPRLIHGVEVTA
ncbi:hypothetical protein ACWGI8_12170 [Streptomyces sp. NPDC054841]